MIVLASASPRRRALLAQIALPCLVDPAAIDESRHAGELPHDYVRRLALEKARTVAARQPECAILAADTTVVLGEEVLNKPQDLAEAKAMLLRLAGKTHQVQTGIAVVWQGQERSHVETTAVTFTSILDEELAAYLATGDSMDKAGAYGIQGYAGRWVRGIAGDFFNVMGLPLAATVQLLREAAVPALVTKGDSTSKSTARTR